MELSPQPDFYDSQIHSDYNTILQYKIFIPGYRSAGQTSVRKMADHDKTRSVQTTGWLYPKYNTFKKRQENSAP